MCLQLQITDGGRVRHFDITFLIQYICIQEKCLCNNTVSEDCSLYCMNGCFQKAKYVSP